MEDFSSMTEMDTDNQVKKNNSKEVSINLLKYPFNNIIRKNESKEKK
jgi:hypothetical protein